jgi:hypothetical protein
MSFAVLEPTLQPLIRFAQNRYQDPTTKAWLNSAVYQNCNYTWSVNHQAQDLFGLDVFGKATSQTLTSPSTAQGPGCAALAELPAEHRPVVLWFFTYRTAPISSAVVFCTPKIELWAVNATVDLNTHNLTSVVTNTLLDTTAANNMSALGGSAFNGAAWPSNDSVTLNTTVDPFIAARQSATLLQLPAAVFQAAADSQGGIADSFNNNRMVPYAQAIYVRAAVRAPSLC